MPDKLMSMRRAAFERPGSRPVLLAIAGDSAAGKTTLTRGLVAALGDERVIALCSDDYHRYDRQERRTLPFTPLHPRCNHIDILEQHLQLLATGEPILKPVYDHTSGTFTRPVRVEPHPFVIVEGLHPLSTRLMRACFDITVYLDPPEKIRHEWKLARDCAARGYTPEQVREELVRREPESAAYIRPQREHADVVVQFAPLSMALGVDHAAIDVPDSILSAMLLLRPTIPHPDLSAVLGDDTRAALHLKLVRDADGKPVDALHIHGHADPALSRRVEEHIWADLGSDERLPDALGVLEPGRRSDPLALTQLILLFHLLHAARVVRQPEAASAPA
jgi:phosphoribulokinase